MRPEGEDIGESPTVQDTSELVLRLRNETTSERPAGQELLLGAFKVDAANFAAAAAALPVSPSAQSP